MRYDHLIPTDDQIRNALYMQVMARLRPKHINVPDGWKPVTQLDRLIHKNMTTLAPDFVYKDLHVGAGDYVWHV